MRRGVPPFRMTGVDDDVVAELHLHTTASDGALALDEVPAAARDAGVACVAVTDHDRCHPGLDAPVVDRDGVTVIRGVELRVDAGDRRVDLLGYAARRTDGLVAELDRIQRDRIQRARRMVECLEDRLGVDLALDAAEGVGRPHIARAVAESDADYDYQGAFDRLIGADCPCYVARDLPSFETGARLLREACDVVSLAHPFRYPDPAAALELAADLDAVERYYPYGRPVDTDLVDRVAAEHDLLVTGGSDAHDRTLGVAGLPPGPFRRFAARIEDVPVAQG